MNGRARVITIRLGEVRCIILSTLLIYTTICPIKGPASSLAVCTWSKLLIHTTIIFFLSHALTVGPFSNPLNNSAVRDLGYNAGNGGTNVEWRRPGALKQARWISSATGKEGVILIDLVTLITCVIQHQDTVCEHLGVFLNTPHSGQSRINLFERLRGTGLSWPYSSHGWDRGQNSLALLTLHIARNRILKHIFVAVTALPLPFTLNDMRIRMKWECKQIELKLKAQETQTFTKFAKDRTY